MEDQNKFLMLRIEALEKRILELEMKVTREIRVIDPIFLEPINK